MTELTAPRSYYTNIATSRDNPNRTHSSNKYQTPGHDPRCRLDPRGRCGEAHLRDGRLQNPLANRSRSRDRNYYEGDNNLPYNQYSSHPRDGRRLANRSRSRDRHYYDEVNNNLPYNQYSSHPRDGRRLTTRSRSRDRYYYEDDDYLSYNEHGRRLRDGEDRGENLYFQEYDEEHDLPPAPGRVSQAGTPQAGPSDHSATTVQRGRPAGLSREWDVVVRTHADMDRISEWIANLPWTNRDAIRRRLDLLVSMYNKAKPGYVLVVDTEAVKFRFHWEGIHEPGDKKDWYRWRTLGGTDINPFISSLEDDLDVPPADPDQAVVHFHEGGRGEWPIGVLSGGGAALTKFYLCGAEFKAGHFHLGCHWKWYGYCPYFHHPDELGEKRLKDLWKVCDKLDSTINDVSFAMYFRVKFKIIADRALRFDFWKYCEHYGCTRPDDYWKWQLSWLQEADRYRNRNAVPNELDPASYPRNRLSTTEQDWETLQQKQKEFGQPKPHSSTWQHTISERDERRVSEWTERTLHRAGEGEGN